MTEHVMTHVVICPCCGKEYYTPTEEGAETMMKGFRTNYSKTLGGRKSPRKAQSSKTNLEKGREKRWPKVDLDLSLKQELVKAHEYMDREGDK